MQIKHRVSLFEAALVMAATDGACVSETERDRRFSDADLMSNGKDIANSVGDFTFRSDACFTPSKDISVCGDGVLRCSVSENGEGRSKCSNGNRS
jgi:hypothetical protein